MSKILNQSLKKKSALIEHSFTKVYTLRNAGIPSKVKPAVVLYILASKFAFDLSNLQTTYLEKKIIQSAFKHQLDVDSRGFYKLQTTQFVLHCLKLTEILKENCVYQQSIFRPASPAFLSKGAKVQKPIFSNNNVKLLEARPKKFKNRLVSKGPFMISGEDPYKITQSKKENQLPLPSAFAEATANAKVEHAKKTKKVGGPKQILFHRFYASNLMCANWVLNQIVGLLSKSEKKSPRPVVNQYINDIRILIRSMGSSTPILGIRITITGRLGSQKKAMAQQITKCVGKVPLSTLRQNIDNSQGFVRTRFGVIGVSVWVCYKS